MPSFDHHDVSVAEGLVLAGDLYKKIATLPAAEKEAPDPKGGDSDTVSTNRNAVGGRWYRF